MLLGDEVVAVILEPGYGPVGHMAGGRVLLLDPGATSSYAGDPVQHCPLHDLEVDVGVDPLPDLKDVWGHDVTLIGHHTGHHNRLRKLGFHHFGNILKRQAAIHLLYI